MKVLFAASECFPFVKIGGLADVVGGLPKYLKKLGVDVSVVLPCYQKITASSFELTEVGQFTVNFANKQEIVTVLSSFLPGSEVLVYFLKNERYLSSVGIYGGEQLSKEEEGLRFVFFSKAVVEFITYIYQKNKYLFNVIHCHDWHTAMVPTLLKNSYYQPIPKTILTIHNLGAAYQGVFKKEIILSSGLPFESIHALENDNVNILREGIIEADVVSTVSKTYSLEITTKEQGEGLDEYLRNKKSMVGILNGIDYDVWNPLKDVVIPHKLSTEFNEFCESKMLNKQKLLSQLGISGETTNLLVGMITRVAEQKGFDILLPVMDELLSKKDLKLVILGVGDTVLEEKLSGLSLKHRENFYFLKRFDEYFAHLIYAASDLFLMPSKFEPSGLGQLIAMRYGAIPVVRKTGGLADSVKDKVTGFVFSEYSSESLLQKIMEAKNSYFSDRENFLKMIDCARKEDFSWEKSAKQYLNLYQFGR